MPDDWSKLRDIGPLADTRACFELEVPLAEFPRVRPLLAEPGGRARGRIRFERERGFAIAEVELEAGVTLCCQRCLDPVPIRIESTGRVALVADAAEAERAGAELDTVLAPEHRLSLRDLLEEELLLALPLVPRHEPACEAQPGGAASAPQATGRDATEPASDRQRPFAQLERLLAKGEQAREGTAKGRKPRN